MSHLKKMTQQKPQKKRDWVELKKEFMLGDYVTAAEFRRAKKLPKWTIDKTKGWSEEKKKMKESALNKTMSRANDKEFEDLAEIRLKQARIARFMQLKGVAYLKDENVTFKSADEARKMINTGLSQERSALGLNNPEKKGDTNLTQINIGGKTNFDKLLETLNYEGIIELIANIKRERDRRALSNSSSESTGQIQDGEVI